MNYLVGYSKSAELKSTIDGGNTDKRCCDFISLLIMILMQVFGMHRELHVCIYTFEHILLPLEEKSLLRS